MNGEYPSFNMPEKIDEDLLLADTVVELNGIIKDYTRRQVGEEVYDRVWSLQQELKDHDPYRFDDWEQDIPVYLQIASEYANQGVDFDSAVVLGRIHANNPYINDTDDELYDLAHSLIDETIRGWISDKLDGYRCNSIADGVLSVERTISEVTSLHVGFRIGLDSRLIEEVAVFLEHTVESLSPSVVETESIQEYLSPSDYHNYGVDVEGLKGQLLRAASEARRKFTK